MGFQFELPPTWRKFTDEERALQIAFTPAHLDAAWSSSPYVGDIHFQMQDMRVQEFFTGNDVSIFIQELQPGTEGLFSEREYLQLMMYNALDMEWGYSNFQIGDSSKQLGDINWYYMTFERGSITQAYIINMQDEFIHTILISIHEGDVQNIKDIWSNFSEIEPRFKGEDGVIPTMDNNPYTATRGTWEGNVYTNSCLNLKMTVPEHFSFSSDEELARFMMISADFMTGDTIDSNLLLATFREGSTVLIMSAYGLRRHIYPSVDLYVRAVPRGMRCFSVMEYLEVQLTGEGPHWGALGFGTQISIESDTVEIAGHQWHFGSAKVPTPDFEFTVHAFITIANNHIWRMRIRTHDDDDLYEILSMFSKSS